MEGRPCCVYRHSVYVAVCYSLLAYISAALPLNFICDMYFVSKKRCTFAGVLVRIPARGHSA